MAPMRRPAPQLVGGEMLAARRRRLDDLERKLSIAEEQLRYLHGLASRLDASDPRCTSALARFEEAFSVLSWTVS